MFFINESIFFNKNNAIKKDEYDELYKQFIELTNNLKIFSKKICNTCNVDISTENDKYNKVRQINSTIDDQIKYIDNCYKKKDKIRLFGQIEFIIKNNIDNDGYFKDDNESIDREVNTLKKIDSSFKLFASQYGFNNRYDRMGNVTYYDNSKKYNEFRLFFNYDYTFIIGIEYKKQFYAMQESSIFDDIKFI